MKTLEKPQVA